MIACCPYNIVVCILSALSAFPISFHSSPLLSFLPSLHIILFHQMTHYHTLMWLHLRSILSTATIEYRTRWGFVVLFHPLPVWFLLGR
jgi:hypothetical protein